ncbi:MAG: hypothetical protein ACHREM_33780, partial [Polyangiales bacterium]
MYHTSVLHRGLAGTLLLASCASPPRADDRVRASTARASAGDVTPTRLVAASVRPTGAALSSARSSSRAIVAPRGVAEPRPSVRVSRETLIFAVADQPVRRRSLPVDTPEGASLYLLAGASTTPVATTLDLFECVGGKQLTHATIDPSAPLTPAFEFARDATAGDYPIDVGSVAHTLE